MDPTQELAQFEPDPDGVGSLEPAAASAGPEDDPQWIVWPDAAQERACPVEHRRPAVAEAFYERRGRFDVREQEGDGAVRQLRHAAKARASLHALLA